MSEARHLRPVDAGDDGDADAIDLPAEHERPCFIVVDDWTPARGRAKPLRPGVHHCGMTRGGRQEPPSPVESWVCGPLYVEAQTHDADDNNFGRLLRFKTSAGRWRIWAMPAELLAGNGEALRAELLAMGLVIEPTQRAKVGEFIARRPAKRAVRCTTATGWAGPDAFVLPDRVIGPGAASVVYQTGERAPEGYGTAGTLDDWRQRVAALGEGNPWVTLALSAAFTGPVLARCHAEGGGLHVFGDSSTGKTTLAEVAASVWGKPAAFKHSWRATANGIEGISAHHNDLLLPLDELSECDPREVGAVAYMIANGVGKSRASRTGAARPPKRWCVFVVSTGERTIAATMLEAGKRQMAGQQVRLLDVPAGRRHGVFDALHGRANGRALADELKHAAAACYGTAGRAFLERLTADERDLGARLERARTLTGFASDGGQEARAAARFALVGIAGELATEYGLTDWPEGAALDAAAEAFRAWLDHRGRGQDEPTKIRRAVLDFIDRHGASRFDDRSEPKATATRDRAGWHDRGRNRFMFTSAGLREALSGFDFKPALGVLTACGALEPGSDGKSAQAERIHGHRTRVYVIDPEKLELADDGA